MDGMTTFFLIYYFHSLWVVQQLQSRPVWPDPLCSAGCCLLWCLCGSFSWSEDTPDPSGWTVGWWLSPPLLATRHTHTQKLHWSNKSCKFVVNLFQCTHVNTPFRTVTHLHTYSMFYTNCVCVCVRLNVTLPSCCVFGWYQTPIPLHNIP